MKSPFTKLIWLGNPPSNKAREALLKQLLGLLEYEGTLASAYLPSDSERALVLGNFEDWKKAEFVWPIADSKQCYLGLFVSDFPNSTEILHYFEAKQITFLWNEDSTLDSLREAFSDLLLGIT